MKYRILLLCTTSLIVCSFTNPNTCVATGKYDTFDSTTVIHLYYGGGMRYESDNAWIRFDSCVYVHMDHGAEVRTARIMTAEKRKQIMELLKEYRFYELKQDNKKGFAHDKATTQICVEQNGTSKACIASSAGSDVRENDQADFSSLYDALLVFVTTGVRK